MYESREASESRGFCCPSYSILSSESRDSGESRSFIPYQTCSSESREASESCFIPPTRISSISAESRMSGESCTPLIRDGSRVTGLSKVPVIRKESDSNIPNKYNNFADIDSLIEQLEVTIPILEQLQGRGTEYSKSLQRRQQQIERLRQIREERLISEIEKESDDFDKKIEGVMKLTKSPKAKRSTERKSTSSGSSSWGGWSSESRDSGESRW